MGVLGFCNIALSANVFICCSGKITDLTATPHTHVLVFYVAHLFKVILGVLSVDNL